MANSPQSEEAKRIKAARPEPNGQELKPVIYQGLEIPKYKIAEDGLVMSYYLNKVDGRPLSWVAGGSAKGFRYPGVKLQIPVDGWGDYVNRESVNYRAKNDVIGRVVLVHILVAETWFGIDNCPEELEPYWNRIPLAAKKIIRRLFQVDHIDNDRSNPNISNLRYVSPRGNNHYIKNHKKENE